jgi:hypothetical protein
MTSRQMFAQPIPAQSGHARRSRNARGLDNPSRLMLTLPLVVAWAMIGCQSGSTGNTAGSGGHTGGSSSSQGTSPSGGKVSSGGATGSGGVNGSGDTGTGGAPAGSGGATATAGASGKGGSVASGGVNASGGTVAKAGTSDSAGSLAGTGGAGSPGGTTGKGGSTGMGGGSGTTPDAGRDSSAAGGAVAGATGAGGSGTGGSTGACTPPAPGSKGKNPLFTDVYTADPAAFVYNCTFYINCGHDEGGGQGFVMNNWFILKSTDMVTWTRIDKALAISTFKWSDSNAWAGQMVSKGGKFYWYVPINKIGSCPNNCGMAIGVAVGDSPEGPFKDAIGKPLIDDVLEMSTMGFAKDSDTPYTIDPTVYVDADDGGKAYMHYGSFGRVVHVNLGDDMISVSGKMKEIDLGCITASDNKRCFFESSYLTKRNGKWYEIFASGDNPSAINYSIADNPAGPWTAKGRILDPLPTTSTDGATNHAGVADLAGQWYIVYHVSNGPNGGGTYHREVAIDKLNFNADGTIQKVTPSSGLSF